VFSRLLTWVGCPDRLYQLLTNQVIQRAGNSYCAQNVRCTTCWKTVISTIGSDSRSNISAKRVKTSYVPCRDLLWTFGWFSLAILCRHFVDYSGLWCSHRQCHGIPLVAKQNGFPQVEPLLFSFRNDTHIACPIRTSKAINLLVTYSLRSGALTMTFAICNLVTVSPFPTALSLSRIYTAGSSFACPRLWFMFRRSYVMSCCMTAIKELRHRFFFVLVRRRSFKIFFKLYTHA
jgi:hypothetical protein